MKNIATTLLVAPIASLTILLAGCVSTSPIVDATTTPSTVVPKEASLRGSRLCFLKKGNGTVIVQASPNVVADPEMYSADGGDVSNQERCFTGYNAYSDVIYDNNPASDTEEDVVVDVSSPSGAIRMMATNYAISAPAFGYDIDFTTKHRDGAKFEMSEGDSLSVGYQGFKFTVERRNDSSDFKEFLVTFNTPAN